MLEWAEFWKKWYYELTKTWGLNPSFAQIVTVILYYLTYFGVRWTITSGLRSKAQQKALMDRYKSGDPSVRVAPATNSRHLTGDAIDISTDHPVGLGWLAKTFGLRWGGDFSKPDPIHIDAG